jgi:hypothetical protein
VVLRLVVVDVEVWEVSDVELVDVVAEVVSSV